MIKKYNDKNLKRFTKANAKYYGSRGGRASGKSKFENIILKTILSRQMIILFLDKYKDRKRFYNKDYEYIKKQLHYIKLYDNKIKKLQNKYYQKYSEIPRANNEIF